MAHILSAFREKAKTRLNDFPATRFNLPEKIAEKKTSLEGLDFANKSPRLVFVDGHFEPALSDTSSLPKSCVVLPMLAALPIYGLALQNRWKSVLSREQDPFALLNAAHFEGAALLYIPPNLCLPSPLHIISVFSSSDLMTPRLQIFVGKNSHVNLLRSHTGGGVCIDVLDAVLEEDASLNICEDSDLSDGSSLFQSTRIHLKKNAAFFHRTYSEGNTRQNLHVRLAEEGASTELKGLSCIAKELQDHTHILVEHAAPSCTSRQHFKKALKDSAASHFEGKIYVTKDAQKTHAYQLSQNLLLSPLAKATAQPNLEIFADDVKASHGATFTQLQKEELFYLRSRGFGEIQAKNLLFLGFCKEFLEEAKISEWKEQVMKRVCEFT